MRYTICAVLINEGKKVMRVLTLEAETEVQAISEVRRSMQGKQIFIDLIDRVEIEKII